MDSTFAGLNVWGFFWAITLVSAPTGTTSLPPSLPPVRLSVCLSAGDFTEQETHSLSLSLWLCPSQSVAINHLKWAALTGSWPHHSFIFFYPPPSNCTIQFLKTNLLAPTPSFTSSQPPTADPTSSPHPQMRK